MGWCSGTDVFDDIAKHIIDDSDMDEDKAVDLLVVVIKALEAQDWDCQSESQVYDNDFVQQALNKVHPEWYADE